MRRRLPDEPTRALWCSGNFRDSSFGPLVERRGDGLCLHGLVANHDFDLFSRPGAVDRKITVADVPVQSGRRRTAGDPAGRFGADGHFIAIAPDTAAAHFEARQLAGEASF